MNAHRKRSAQIRLVLLSGIASGALAGCSDKAAQGLPAAQRVYPNDYYVEGAGYYHAPFGNWYQLPYNSTKNLQPGQPALYYYGGQWGRQPHESVINLSAPNAEGLRALEQAHHISRGGFGSSYHSYGGRSFFS